MVASVLIVLTIGTASSASAHASSDAPADCAPASEAQLTATLTADGTATYTVHNAVPLCDPMAIGVALYLKNADGFVVPQTLVASKTGTITSGSTTLHVEVPTSGTTPMCFTQLDAFTGAPLPQITESDQYRERLLAYLWGTIPNCGEVEAESTTTSTTSTTSTTTTSTTTTTIQVGPGNSNRPAQVEAVETERSPAQTEAVETERSPAQTALPQTGPRLDLGPLLSSSGSLLLLGGALLALVNRPRAHA